MAALFQPGGFSFGSDAGDLPLRRVIRRLSMLTKHLAPPQLTPIHHSGMALIPALGTPAYLEWASAFSEINPDAVSPIPRHSRLFQTLRRVMVREQQSVQKAFVR